MKDSVFWLKLRRMRAALCVALALVLCLGMFPQAAFGDSGGGGAAGPRGVSAASGDITVYMDFEGYNLGQGFYVEPQAVTVPEGSSVAFVTDKLLRELEIAYSNSGSLENSFFLNGLNLPNRSEEVSLPDYITSQESFGDEYDADGIKDNEWLSDFDYTFMSGWMFTINHEMTDGGASDCILDDGAVIRWQFSVFGTGADLGVPLKGFGAPPPYYEHADKTALVRALFADGAVDGARQAALTTLIDPLATPELVDEAVTALSTVQEDAWLTINVLGGSSSRDVQSDIQAALREQFGQSAPYDYSKILRLKVTGVCNMALLDVLRTGYSYSINIAGTLLELDLSEASVEYGPKKLTALKSVIMSGGNLPITTFDGDTSLETISFGNVNAINQKNMFRSCPNLRTLIFRSGNAPAIAETAFENSINAQTDARVFVAKVPDKTTGGYEQDSFRQFFARVENIVDTPSATAEEFLALAAAIARAGNLTESDYTGQSWSAMQEALSHAEEIYNADPASSSADVNSAKDALLAAINGLQFSDAFTLIKVTKGVNIGIYRKGGNHFAPFTSIPFTEDVAHSTDAYDAYKFSPQSNEFHIEASAPGKTVKVAKRMASSTAGQTITIEPTPLDEWTPVDNGYYAANLYTNLGDSGTVDLEEGGHFDLDTFRVWQAEDGPTENYFIEPDYKFELSGNSVSIAAIGSPGREQLRITAVQSGVSVIKISYDPIEYIMPNGSTTHKFNGIATGNTGVVVVNVGGGTASFGTGLTARNDFDTFYFDKAAGSRTFTFTPAAGTSVRVHDPLNISAWGSGWHDDYSAGADGSFTVTLKEGRNIVELENGGSKKYHVLRAKGVDVAVANVTRPGEAFAAGDAASITVSGIETAVEKLAGIYNPGFYSGSGTDIRPQIKYTDGTTTVESGKGKQYQSLITGFSVNYTVPSNIEERTGVVLKGQYYIGIMGSYNVQLGAHRSIAMGGIPIMNGSAFSQGPWAFGSLPEIELIAPQPDDANEENPSGYQEALADTLRYVRTSTPSPTVSVIGGEWAVIALARSGALTQAQKDELTAKYLANLQAFVENSSNIVSHDASTGKIVIHKSKYTENERVVLALTALGYNAADITLGAKKYDFVAALLDRQANDSSKYQAVWQGVNGAMFALIALDSGDYYKGTDAGTAARQYFLDYILSRQNAASGTWGLSDGSMSADITGMALQALAPYYTGKLPMPIPAQTSQAAVTAAVDKAITWLSENQAVNGAIGKTSSGEPYEQTLEAVVQPLVGLSALGIDAADDSRFVKNGKSLLDGLLSFSVGDGSFRHIASGNKDGMATEQAAYALVAYDRFKKGLDTLYDMTAQTATPPADVVDTPRPPIYPPPTDTMTPEPTSCSVIFNANGGLFKGKAKTKSIAVAIGGKYVLPNEPKREGYSFAGWYTSKKGGKTVTTATVVKAKTTHTLWAHWAVTKKSVTFNANGGKITVKKSGKSKGVKSIETSAKYGKKYALPKTPKRAGYKFLGWYTSKKGGTKITKSSKVKFIGANQTLYAHWRKK
ncbi:MAG: InlB B-repeat-containing protein [Clostridiales Family XIII bacterium]|jgi:uncharacterized repeat protein (TIGR02543 family)|nr:InlB B-repeat-containing protein [Clostridiales Family XIII bacterium]